MAYFETKDYANAIDLLASMSEWRSDSTFVWYNMACAHALSGDTANALLALQAAFDAGYKNVAHVLTDDDLVSIRAEPVFGAMLNRVIESVARDDE